MILLSFNQKEYIKQYEKNNYKKSTIRTKLDLYRRIDDYCQFNGLSISEFFNNAAKYIIDEKIDIKGYK